MGELAENDPLEVTVSVLYSSLDSRVIITEVAFRDKRVQSWYVNEKKECVTFKHKRYSIPSSYLKNRMIYATQLLSTGADRVSVRIPGVNQRSVPESESALNSDYKRISYFARNANSPKGIALLKKSRSRYSRDQTYLLELIYVQENN